MVTTLEKANEQGNIDFIERKPIEVMGAAPEVANLGKVKVKDPENKRWTDADFSLRKWGSRVKACVSHEKGYPTEDKGQVDKCISLNWLSEKIPSLEE